VERPDSSLVGQEAIKDIPVRLGLLQQVVMVVLRPRPPPLAALALLSEMEATAGSTSRVVAVVAVDLVVLVVLARLPLGRVHNQKLVARRGPLLQEIH
jgi:hypothetical protein